jgi:hypothetical protein
MLELALLLKILEAANMATPTLVGIINTIKSGRAAGKTDDEIQAESMALALETKAITEKDMGDQP